MKKIRGFDRDRNASHPINRLRREMSDQCEAFALERPSGIYTLSIPTGGGKTLASLRYAIKHAIATGKERIVYIVPYTTIIEQNAAEIRDILQEHDLILEHHSNVVEEIGEETEDYDVRKKKSGWPETIGTGRLFLRRWCSF
ncbi:DEAD/DEAH box helicase [Paenibacillus cisolokensis]|nr:DEAD/DEAH box helicase [Paenibacillus cisolokensis]